jgi:hypothetical protein
MARGATALPITRDSEGNYRDQSGRDLTTDGFGGLYDSAGARVGRTDGFRSRELPDPYAASTPKSAPATAPSSGGGAIFIAIFIWPVLLELLAVSVQVYALISPVSPSLRLGLPPPVLGLHPVWGLMAAILIMALYVFLHGFRVLAIVYGLAMSMIWAIWIHRVENPGFSASAFWAQLQAAPDAWIVFRQHLTSAAWTWTLVAAITAAIGRAAFFLWARPVALQCLRIRSLKDAQVLARKGGSELLGIAVVAAVLYGGYRLVTLF